MSQVVAPPIQVAPSRPSPVAALQRQKNVYRYYIGIVAFLIFAAFVQPLFQRVMAGDWGHNNIVHEWTLSLDFHGFIAFAFLGLCLFQIILGYLQDRRPALRRPHRLIGRFVMYLIVPAFCVTGIWTVFDRATNVDLSKSLVFDMDREITMFGLVLTMVYILCFWARSLYGLRKKDINLHFDGIVGVFIVSGTVALLRFIYTALWQVFDEVLLSFVVMYFITLCLEFGILVSAYALAGRFRENKKMLIAMGVSIVLVIVFGMPYYHLFDYSPSVR